MKTTTNYKDLKLPEKYDIKLSQLGEWMTIIEAKESEKSGIINALEDAYKAGFYSGMNWRINEEQEQPST